MNLKYNKFTYSLSLLACLLCLTSVIFYSCQSKGNGKSEADNKNKTQSFLDGYIVKPLKLEQTISVSGSLIAFEETILMSETSGRVVMLNLPEGEFIKQGTLLVQLFNDDLLANLNKLKTQLEIAEQTYKRQTELIKVNGISQTDYDQTVLQVHSIKADIDIMKAQIRKTQIQAPFDGIIGLRKISVGAEVNPTIPLATIRSKNKLKLDFSIPEKYGNQVKPGMKIKFTIHGTDKIFDATVMATEQEIEAITRNLKVRSLVNTTSDLLIPGAFTNVILTLGVNNEALMIPTQAIIPMERDKSVIVSKHGKATFVIVKTGTRKESLVEITDGINAGDTVVTTGLMFIKKGMKLKFSSITKDNI